MLRNGSKKEDTYQQKKTFEFWHQIIFSRYRGSITPYTTEPGKMTHAQAHFWQNKAPDKQTEMPQWNLATAEQEEKQIQQ